MQSNVKEIFKMTLHEKAEDRIKAQVEGSILQRLDVFWETVKSGNKSKDGVTQRLA